MKLDHQTRILIAVGASVSANCQPCLQTGVTKAREAGITEQNITVAVEIGKMVRQGAASKMDDFASSLNPAASVSAVAAEGGCGCGS